MAEKEIRALMTGGYVFQESNEPDVFYFYREDEKELTEEEISTTAVEMFQEYIFERMLAGEIKNQKVKSDSIKTVVSKNGKFLRIIVEENQIMPLDEEDDDIPKAFEKAFQEYEEKAKHSENVSIDDINAKLRKIIDSGPDEPYEEIEATLHFGSDRSWGYDYHSSSHKSGLIRKLAKIFRGR
ncbi:MAG: hypothetical protein IJS47_02000 [Clostridia bacterium]|nr:hypothetical protein [Clostridia bacterium]